MKNIGSGTSFVWTIFRLWSGSKLWYHPRTFSSSQLCYRPSISVTNKKGAVDVGDFWTISIINKVIKIISKILSERLQPAGPSQVCQYKAEDIHQGPIHYGIFFSGKRAPN